MEHLVDDWFETLHRLQVNKPWIQEYGDLAVVEFFILLGISVLSDNEEQEEELTLSKIIEVTGMTMSAASRKISILEKKGFVSRCVSDVDKRRTYITLTERGREICEKERIAKRVKIQEIISRMGEQDTQDLLRLLNRMFDTIEEMEQGKTVE